MRGAFKNILYFFTLVCSKIEHSERGETAVNYGIVVRAIREKLGWSQEKLAEKLHMSRSSISKIEGNKQTLDVPTLVHLVRISNTPEIATAIIMGMDGIQIMTQLMPMLGMFCWHLLRFI